MFFRLAVSRDLHRGVALQGRAHFEKVKTGFRGFSVKEWQLLPLADGEQWDSDVTHGKRSGGRSRWRRKPLQAVRWFA